MPLSVSSQTNTDNQSSLGFEKSNRSGKKKIRVINKAKPAIRSQL